MRATLHSAIVLASALAISTSVPGEPPIGVAQRPHRERAAVDPPVDRTRDQTGALEHPEVLGHRRQGHVEWSRQLGDHRRRGGEAREHRAPRAVCEGLEHEVQSIVVERAFPG